MFEFDMIAWYLTIYFAIIGVSIGFVLQKLGSNVRNLLQGGSLICTSIILHVENQISLDKLLVFSIILIVTTIIQYFS